MLVVGGAPAKPPGPLRAGARGRKPPSIEPGYSRSSPPAAYRRGPSSGPAIRTGRHGRMGRVTLPPYWQVTPLAVVALVSGWPTRSGAGGWPPPDRGPPVPDPAPEPGLLRRPVILIAVASGPLERWAMAWLSVHMVTHVFEMFYLPPLLILGAPWVPLCSPCRSRAAPRCFAPTTGHRPGLAAGPCRS